MSSFKNKNKKISICTLISTAVVGVALATALPLTLNSCKKNNNNGGVIDGDRLSDLKVGDNLIGKYFLMPTDGWKIPNDVTWNYTENQFLSFTVRESNYVYMMIKQDSASPSSSTSTEAICFGSDIYNHGGDATKSICSSINDGNGTMKWMGDCGDISKNMAFNDYYYIQLSQENTGATELKIEQIKLTTYDSAFNKFLSNCWVSNNIK